MTSDRRTLSAEELQARLAAIVASSDDAIVSKDLNGVVQSWNAGAQRVFGYTAEEMIGQSIMKLFPPDRADEELQILARLRRGERVDHFRTLRMRKDGEIIVVSLTISPIWAADGRIIGASKIARDITHEVELEEYFQAIVASSDDAIVSKDLNGIVKSWNAGAERLFGWTAREMIGESLLKIIPPDRQDEEPRILERLRRGERVDHFQTVRMHKNGTLLDISVSISPIRDPTGRVIGASKVARDVTAMKRAAIERERLLASEQAARQSAEHANRLKDEFLATVSHELRTPLNAILGWSQLLKSGTCGEQEVSEAIETIERNARLQNQLIEDLLDMSRIISGKMRIDMQPVDLSQVVHNALAAVRPAAEAKAIRLKLSIDSRAPFIDGDASRLQQVLWNLLSNSIKYTPQNGWVEVSLRRDGGQVELRVSDNGQGINPEFIPRLFMRFAQADSSTTRRHGGLGLGLALVRHLTELHGGSVRASSAGPGKGSTFTVSLPVTKGRTDVLDDDRTLAAAGMDINLAGVDVLTIDDEDSARSIVKRILVHRGASVRTANSVQAALASVRQRRPDVILCDIGMPDEDGFAFLSRLRAIDEGHLAPIPVVALTAFARPEDRRRMLLAGFYMHLPKPIEAADVVAVVANVAKISAGSSPAS
jgi:PAS domain S-box-containing protein